MDLIEFHFGKSRYHDQAEIRQWIEDSFGPGKYGAEAASEGISTWSWETQFGNTYYYFVNEEDATMFALRWL